MPFLRRALALALGLILTLSACGGGGGAATRELSATRHNDADVAFATDMIQHHAQALAMVDLARDRPLAPPVQALAEQIREAQAPEIETMSGWLTAWDEEVPPTMRDHVNAGHDGGAVGESMEGMGTDMPGMLSAPELTALEQAADADFQEQWLELMVEHHEGAVERARAERADGLHKPAVDLARAIIEAQEAEIETMKAQLS